MALTQSEFAGRGQNKPCFKCGSTDHWKKDCSKLKNQKGHQQQKGQTGLVPQGNGQTHCNGSQSKNWHFTAPGPRNSEMKEVDGKKVYWCRMCKHWNNTHTTEAHVRGAGGKKPSEGPSAQANLGFVDDPSAWIMDISDTKDLIYCLSIKVPLIIFVMILGSALVPVISVGFVPVWSNFLLYGAQLSPFLIQLWTYSAHLLWLFLFGTMIYYGHRKPPDENDPCRHREKHAESHSSGVISGPANDLSMPTLLTLCSIKAILNIFVNKHFTLAGLLVLWKE
jgi:hypothetical protein